MSPKIDVLSPRVALSSASVLSRDKSSQRMWLSMSPHGSKQKLLPLTLSWASGWQFSRNKIQNTCPLMTRIYLLQTMKFFDKILYLTLQHQFHGKAKFVWHTSIWKQAFCPNGMFKQNSTIPNSPNIQMWSTMQCTQSRIYISVHQASIHMVGFCGSKLFEILVQSDLRNLLCNHHWSLVLVTSRWFTCIEQVQRQLFPCYLVTNGAHPETAIIL